MAGGVDWYRIWSVVLCLCSVCESQVKARGSVILMWFMGLHDYGSEVFDFRVYS